jgi:hypothetical protein
MRPTAYTPRLGTNGGGIVRVEFSIDISRRWLGLFGAVVALSGSLVAAAVVQAHGGSADMIHGCYKDREGNLRWVAASDPCLPSEVAIHWPKRSIADLQVVVAQSPADSATTKRVTASCPAGMLATGGGGGHDSRDAAARASVNTHLSGPVVGPASPDGLIRATGWAVSAIESGGGTAGDWSVTAYAICARPIQ